MQAADGASTAQKALSQVTASPWALLAPLPLHACTHTFMQVLPGGGVNRIQVRVLIRKRNHDAQICVVSHQNLQLNYNR